MKIEETLLIKACQKGEISKFAGLYDLYADRIFRFIYHKTMQRDLAEDLTSETFMKALERFGQFKPKKGEFSAWLYAIARNLITDHWRVYHEHQNIDDVWDLMSLDDVMDKTNKKLLFEKLHEAMRELPVSDREVLMMRYWQDLKFSEIAILTGKSEGAVKMTASRGLKKLREDIPVFILFIILSLLLR